MKPILTRLQDLIAIPSYSKQEDQTAAYLYDDLTRAGVDVDQMGNNILARNLYWDDNRPVLVLNSHHDTVRPASTYTKDPFKPNLESDRLYGLGSNDAGGALCCLIQVFIDYYKATDLPFNLLLIASAEEEISGSGGIEAVLREIPTPWGAIVGEPTQMRAAVAERGLMVVDGHSAGVSGHAARQEGTNALYIALEDIHAIRHFTFTKESRYLPDTQAVVTQISAGTQHNVVPDRCDFVIDVRVNDQYTNEEVFQLLDGITQSTLTARSYRLNSSFLPEEHPLFQAIRSLNIPVYGSPTLSDQALMNFPSLKMGPGRSARSHTADEYIELSELEEGYVKYRAFIESLKNNLP
ncbi:M20/M25/M40 family metallo-hydrolase [Membranicola marinus]|uniref:M20/M25/M40 family metallo-hydrolase n=1 Tax=Membranihabitans marinus TaxID=1227546 RepID=A0A953HXP4_9BACT|nr:M20/M25/M40 family metallo-hydrolase [Membranihabitans marinus]MBY5960115.1 M20/M25/M40 family metallo-hydrolase [Membranihabitans marinus]